MSFVKNLQSFGKLKGICTGLGGAYNPGQQNLQVKALTTIQFNAQQLMDKVTAEKTVYDNMTNQREVAFKELRLLGSRVCYLLRSCGAHPLTLADAYTHNRRLHGWKKYAPPVPSEEAGDEVTPKRRRAAGTDYASMAYHFAQLVETATAEPKYVSTQALLSREGLANKVVELHALNESVLEATLKLNNVKQQRSALFYEGSHSLVATARNVRHHVRATFGFRSDPHEEMVKVRLTKPTT
ncbi:MAG: hypothetical protein WBO32_13105 [Cyclobacteriaceae bacterium]